MHTVADFERARAQLRERCDAKCEQTVEPFEVTGLRDLCSRNPRIPKVYAKCAAAGHPPATEHAPLLRVPMARPDCHSVGANVPFIASVEDGGTITCK